MKAIAKKTYTKNKALKYPMFLLVIFSFLFGCTNQYEKEAIGYYKVINYERKDSADTSKIDFPISLTLNINKTYLLVFKDSTSKGKWKGGDDGDRTWISFFYNDEMQTDGDMGRGLINVWNPRDFNCPQLKTLVFKKVDKK